MSRLRIVAGDFGGRFIDAPPGRAARPTREKVREAWFSALGPDLDGAEVVDLFAGSGALGLEALSRGAARVHFVESDGRTAALLADNVEALGAGVRTEVVRADVAGFLDGLEGAAGPRFDLALADPPYGSGWPVRLAERLGSEPFARLLCVEHRPGAMGDGDGHDRGDAGGEAEEDAPAVAMETGAARVVWRRRYGDTELTFLRAGPPAPGESRDAGDGRPAGGEPDDSTREGGQER